MNIPTAFAQSTLTKEEVVAAWEARTPVTVDGFTGVVSFYDPIPMERGGSPWFFLSTSDVHEDEYGPFYWVR